MEWLKHAFAVDPPGPAVPTAAQRIVVDRLCHEVVRRGLTTPAHLALEMGRPLNYVTAQALQFFQPLVTVLADPAAYGELASFLERRGSLEYIGSRLDAIEAGGIAGFEQHVRPTHNRDTT